MAEEKESFFSRWSRLKREQPATPAPETPAPALPPVEKLTPESDFTDFMHPKVKEELRRLALKKLFSDPHFNTADPFEPYSRDWTVGEPISEEMLATLNQARTVLFRETKDAEAEKAEPSQTAQAEEAQQDEEEAPQEKDEPGRKDA